MNHKLKLGTFIVHFTCSIFLLWWFTRRHLCDSLVNRAAVYSDTERDYYKSETRHIWPVYISENESVPFEYTFDQFTGVDATFSETQLIAKCKGNNDLLENPNRKIIAPKHTCSFQGLMPTIEIAYTQHDFTLGGINDMVFLMLVFEWITAAFALDYLYLALCDKIDGAAGNIADTLKSLKLNIVSMIWNIGLIIITFTQVNKLPLNNILLTVILTLFVLLLQYSRYECDKKEDDPAKLDMTNLPKMLIHFFYIIIGIRDLIVTRYIEYSITAPILMMAVHSIITQAQGWTYGMVFVCMMVTNLIGIPIQKLYTCIGPEKLNKQNPKLR
jgi:hypothetical protein